MKNIRDYLAGINARNKAVDLLRPLDPRLVEGFAALDALVREMRPLLPSQCHDEADRFEAAAATIMAPHQRKLG